jgi:hypothetical protein
MSTTTAKEAEGLTYQQLKDLLEKKKEAEIDKVTKELTAARGIVSSLEAQLANLGVAPAPVAAPVKRGRKPGSQNGTGKPAKAPKKAKGKRGAVGAAITAFVSSKGKSGAKVSEIAAATGFKPANITAFFYAKGNVKKFKKVAPATFAVK